MAKTQRNFVAGRMNKSIDERLLQNGEYVHAQNVRLGSTENSEIGSVENAKGNIELTPSIAFPLPGETYSTNLSPFATCIGKYADEANETIYWFVHDPSWMGPYPDGAPLGAAIVTGTNTALSPNELVDGGATFETDGTVVGAIVVEDANPDNFAYVTSITGNTVLVLSRDMFAAPGTAYTIYQNTHRMDMILSYNVNSQNLIYHIISVYDCIPCTTQWNTTLNFNPNNLITGVNLIDNFLFFTDNHNPPRVIDVTKQYGEPCVSPPVGPQTNPTTTCPIPPGGGGVCGEGDNFTAKEIMVIKEPPTNSPTITLSNNGTERNYIEDKMISFATRYRYEGGEFSALSSFSEIAFSPEPFFYSQDSDLNEGMINKYNAVTVLFETGNELVTDIEVVFKSSDTSLIKIIDRFNKNQLGLNNNSTYSITFDNSKVYTVLPEYEILRLYDNVPIVAKAQTIMGNRLMYGNYQEQYNLVDKFDSIVKPIYDTVLTSKELGVQAATPTFFAADRNVYGQTYANIPNNEVEIDFGNIPLTAGSTLNLTFNIGWANPFWQWTNIPGFPFDTWAGPNPPGSSPFAGGSLVNFRWTLPQDFSSVTEMVSSVAFQLAIGTQTALEGGIAQPFNASSAIATGQSGGYNLTNLINARYSLTVQDAPLQPTYRYKYLSASEVFPPTAGPAPGDPGSATMAVGFDSMPADPNKFKLWLHPMVYVPLNNAGPPPVISNPTGSTGSMPGGSFAVVVPNFANLGASIINAADNKSLHSNRGYEVGIIYMDDWNRATTPITSNQISATEGGGSSGSNIFVPCYLSDRVNKARVTMPSTMVAPRWATHFKFAMKPSEEGYETIYAKNSFTSPESASGAPGTVITYFLLEGENAQKVEAGDKLLVKTDANGAVGTCVYATVLRKEVQEENFITVPDPANPNQNLYVPAGVYMEMSNFPFSTASNVAPSYPVVGIPVTQSTKVSTVLPDGEIIPNICPELYYRGLSGTSTGLNANGEPIYTPMSIPQGTNITIGLRWFKKGALGYTVVGSGTDSQVEWRFHKRYIADQDYNNIIDFFNGMDVHTDMVNEGEKLFVGCSGGVTIDYDPSLAPLTDPTTAWTTPQYDCDSNPCTIFLRWSQTPAGGTDPDNEIQFLVRAGGGTSELNKIECAFNISFQEEVVAFETEGRPANPDLWYEGSDVYPIDVATGSHQGIAANNDVSQVVGTALTGTTGVFNLSFFNCFAFGNGVESYKVNDSLSGRYFLLGQRVTATANEDYRRAHRYADITYSGIINNETNINKSNEFNLGLVNWKSLEDSFGKVQILSGRDTDVLVLQEDKISYVLAGKNLLSDSSGGGTVASVPEVLGTQIARTERFGISNNPESYVEFGLDKFFIDEKRGAVLNLRGSSGQNEQLQVLSEYGMRSWFRDAFNGQLTSSINVYTQKLGGFDPYMNEYVVSLTDRSLFFTPGECDVVISDIETEQDVIACGTTTTFTSPGDLAPMVFWVEFPEDGEGSVGDVSWTFNMTPTDTGAVSEAFIQVQLPIGNDLFPATPIASNTPPNTVTWTKDTPVPTQAYVIITPDPTTMTGAGSFDVNATLNCATPTPINVDTVLYTSQRNCPASNTATYYDPANGPDAVCLVNPLLSWQWQAQSGVIAGNVNQQLIEYFSAWENTATLGNGNIVQDIYQTPIGNDNFPQYPFIPDGWLNPPNAGGGWNDSQWQGLVQGAEAPNVGDYVEMILDLSDLGYIVQGDDTQFTNVNSALNIVFDVNKHSFRYLRTNIDYDRTNRQDAVDLLANSVAINPLGPDFFSWDGQQWVTPAQNGALKYKGVFQMPAPVAPNSDPHLYLLVDIRERQSEWLCHDPGAIGDSTILNEVCCDCSCGAGNYTCYRLQAKTSQYPFTFTVITPGSAPATDTVTLPPYVTEEEGSCITVCSSVYPYLIPGSLPFNADGSQWTVDSIVDITIQSCGDAAGCTDCGTPTVPYTPGTCT